PRMGGVFPLVLQIPGGDSLPSRWDRISAAARYAELWSIPVREFEDGRTESTTDDLRQQWRCGIAHLFNLNQPTASYLPARRKALKPQQLLHSERPIIPMKRACSRPGVCRDSPRRQVLREFQQEGPVSPALTEEFHSATPTSVIEVVCTFGYRRE